MDWPPLRTTEVVAVVMTNYYHHSWPALQLESTDPMRRVFRELLPSTFFPSLGIQTVVEHCSISDFLLFSLLFSNGSTKHSAVLGLSGCPTIVPRLYGDDQ
jgi:hypothetical protein